MGVISLYDGRIQSCMQPELLFVSFSICGIVVWLSVFAVGICCVSMEAGCDSIVDLIQLKLLSFLLLLIATRDTIHHLWTIFSMLVGFDDTAQIFLAHLISRSFTTVIRCCIAVRGGG